MLMMSRLKFDLTPLVDQILDQLPAEVFTSSTTTFLDPAMAGGQFLSRIQKRLRAAGHSDKNISERVWGCEVNTLRVNYARNTKRLVSDHLLVSDFLSHDWGNMKFDVIVGNPPYQKDNNSGRDDDSLWPKFLTRSHELAKEGGYIAFVTPASWGSLGSNPESPGSTIRKKSFDTCQVLWVDFTCKKHFDVGSSFSAYVLRKLLPDPQVKTKFVFDTGIVTTEFSDQPCFPLNYSDAVFGEIIRNFKSQTPYAIVMDDPYPVARSSMVKKKSKGDYVDSPSKKHPHRAYHTNSQTHKYSAYKNKFHAKWKAVFSYSGSWNVEVTKDCSLTDASMCVICDNQAQAESVKSVLTSAPVKFLIDKVYRWSGYYSGSFIRMIPALPMTKIYSEQEVYDLLFTATQQTVLKKYVNALKKG
jgi:hypothetical protein